MIIGIDEVGTGSLAGPVVVGAVALQGTMGDLRDSKKLTHNRRVVIADKIMREASHWAISVSGVKLINRHGLTRCHQDCIRAVTRMIREEYPDAQIILDGNTYVKGIGAHRPMVKADEKVPAVSAASIIAKVFRDDLMVKLAASFPRYGWERNKGYGTEEHLEALKKYGVTEHHRRNYKPVREALIGRH